MFSTNSRPRLKNLIMQILGLQAETCGGKYLGLPTYVGRERAKAFVYLRERIWKRIKGWKENFLSKAGKEILVKAVAQAIPTYAMACFDLTKSLCDSISQMICRYWWSQQDNENKMHWVSWEKMMMPKCVGGLGFRDLHLFNMAMLARQGWRLLQAPNSLCGRVLKAKYFSNTSLLDATPTPGISYVWRSILKGIQVLKEDLIWRIRDGSSVRIWDDPWLPRGTTRRPRNYQGDSPLDRISDMI
jgi:hypothetical protein